MVEIEGTRAVVIGRLDDKTPIGYTIFSGEDAKRSEHEDNNTLIGAGDYAQWFVKAKISTAQGAEPMYLLCHVEGFKYDYKRCTEAQTRSELKL